MEHITRKQWFQHIKSPQITFTNIRARLSYILSSDPMLPTKKRTLLQAINDGSFAACTVLTEKLISKYLPESEIIDKWNLVQQNQWTLVTAAENVTPITTKARENTNEILIQLF